MNDGEDKVLKVLGERLLEYQRLVNQKALFSAATRLGEISRSLTTLSGKNRIKWERELDAVVVPAEMVNEVVQGISEDIERIRRICSNGGKYLFEEICLLLSLRMDVKCALEFLGRSGENACADSVSTIDAFLLELATDLKTRKSMEEAAVHISRNFGLPIASDDFLPAGW